MPSLVSAATLAAAPVLAGAGVGHDGAPALDDGRAQVAVPNATLERLHQQLRTLALLRDQLREHRESAWGYHRQGAGDGNGAGGAAFADGTFDRFEALLPSPDLAGDLVNATETQAAALTAFESTLDDQRRPRVVRWDALGLPGRPRGPRRVTRGQLGETRGHRDDPGRR